MIASDNATIADCLIGIGANQGDRRATMDAAIEQMANEPGVWVVKQSSWHETSPVGGPAGQAPFFNAAVRLGTSLAPQALLALLLRIEDSLGRRRSIRWGPRTIDLDLLLYDDLILAPNPADEQPLELPHPRMAWRRFVLAPAVEAAPDMVHPTTGWSIAQLWRHLNEAPWHAALTGGETSVRRQMARRLADKIKGTLIEEAELESKFTITTQEFDDDMMRESRAFIRQMQLNMSAESQAKLRRGHWAISDAWFGESMKLAKAITSDWEGLLRRTRAELFGSPKILIAIESSEGDSRAWAEELRRRRDGPMLIVSAADEWAAFDEVYAALLAMQ